jgi:predicted Zn-dependent protease
MSFPGLDPAAVARALALVVGETEDAAEVYFERRIEAELPPEGDATGFRTRREEGLAARIVRGERSWIASRDGLGGEALVETLRQVARVWPAAAPEPVLAVGPSATEVPEQTMREFPGRLERELRRRLAAFPLRLTVRWQRRDLRVVGPRMVAPEEREAFFGIEAELPWGRCGALEVELDDARAAAFANRLLARFRARDAAPPEAGRPPLLLAPAACAVALHEAVAHAFEADLLAASGQPAAAVGLDFEAPALDVLDDPSAAPEGVDRATDDEGVAVARRWLLRAGRVEQPIADAGACRRWPELAPGSGFRSGRHAPPRPRTHHLELLPASASEAELLAAAEGGIWVGELDSGRLDPATGEFRLEAPSGRRVRGGAAGEPVGRFEIRGRVAELLAGIVTLGRDVEAAGAGWCAKHGERRAVWATVPSVVVNGLEVRP